MARTVFWSWQSDQPARVTRDVIRDALAEALRRLAAEVDEAERPEIDHDTRGVPGIPEIAATILEKIDRASVFVADVTPIVVTAAGKHVANPNVLIDLGYAKKAVGTDRIVLVWNTAVTDARPEDLPFDLRHRRAPFSFALAENASRSELKTAREGLADQLQTALAGILGTIPAPPAPQPHWHPNEPDQPSVWHGVGEPLLVNTGEDGPARIRMAGLPRGFARLLPSKWQPRNDALQVLHNGMRNPIPLGGYRELNWGPTRGGFLVYGSSDRIRSSGLTPTATRWFKGTGEFWGVDSSFFTPSVGQLAFSNGRAWERFVAWLRHNSLLAQEIGAAGDFKVIIGIDGILGTIWGGATGGTWEALEERLQHEFDLTDPMSATVDAEVNLFINKAREAYGLPALRLA